MKDYPTQPDWYETWRQGKGQAEPTLDAVMAAFLPLWSQCSPTRREEVVAELQALINPTAAADVPPPPPPYYYTPEESLDRKGGPKSVYPPKEIQHLLRTLFDMDPKLQEHAVTASAIQKALLARWGREAETLLATMAPPELRRNLLALCQSGYLIDTQPVRMKEKRHVARFRRVQDLPPTMLQQIRAGQQRDPRPVRARSHRDNGTTAPTAGAQPLPIQLSPPPSGASCTTAPPKPAGPVSSPPLA